MSLSKSLPENLPMGYRFYPTDEQHIKLLWLKTMGKVSEVDYLVSEIDVYSCDPWDLPSKSKIKSDDQVWWFFSRRDYKNPSSSSSSKRCKRRTKSGSWKITGTERQIKDPVTKACVGKKKILVFLPSGRTPGQKTDWVVHQYSLPPQNDLPIPHQRDYVICRLEYRSEEKASTSGCDDGKPSGDMVSVSLCDTETPVENKSDEEAGSRGYDEGEPSSGITSVSDIENSVAHTALFEDGQLEGNVDSFSPPIFSPDSIFTMEDIDGFNGGLGINYEHYLEPVNALPGPPGGDEDKPRGNIPSNIGNPVARAAISQEQVHAEENADSLLESISSSDWCFYLEDIDGFDDGQNIKRLEPEESPVEFLDGLALPQCKNYYEETTFNRFNDSIQPTSLKRPLDVPASDDMNVEGVNGRVKRSRLLAFGDDSNFYEPVQENISMLEKL